MLRACLTSKSDAVEKFARVLREQTMRCPTGVWRELRKSSAVRGGAIDLVHGARQSLLLG